MIKIATAECFTHGLIAREIHALSQGYEGEFGCKYLYSDNNSILRENEFKTSEETPPCDTTKSDISQYDMSVICGIFVPTVSGLKDILKINAPTPMQTIKGIKVYDENYDKKVATMMANAIKDITEANIGIGTTAGIGRGGIAISTNEFTLITTSGYYADLTSQCSSQLLKRQTKGVEKALDIFMDILNDDLGRIMEKYDVQLNINDAK